jgi:hypothetical protein
MSHRLFNSLVVSSTLLLEGGLTGCAGTPSERASTDGTNGNAVEATAGSEAHDDASASTEPESTEPVVVDAAEQITMAACEPGWHSTKAGPSCEVDTSGVTVCCPSYVMVTAENRASVCCEQQP